METTTATLTADSAMAPACVPADPPTVVAREHEIDEVMQFLRFSVKPSSTFDGTILFKFKGDDGKPALSYAVEVAEDRRVSTHKNATAADVRATCEVTISVDDFLYIYSGQASSADIVKLFYAGKLAISGYAFRKVSSFAQSFDFSSEQWRTFYAWRDAQQQSQPATHQRSPSAVEEVRNVGSPSRDFWFAHCRSVLDRYNVSQLQQLQWTTSMASVVGEQFALANVCRAIEEASKAADAQRRQHELRPRADSFSSAIANVLGASSAVLKRDSFAQPMRIAQTPTGGIATTTGSGQLDVHHELAYYFNPCTKQTARVVEAVSTRKLGVSETHLELFGFFDEAYIRAVKHSAKERFQQQTRTKNRVDLADAGMAQLAKLVQAIGRGGHCNRTNNTQSKYIPAPELLLREFNGNATIVMDLLCEKALGRKALDKIPAPSIDWLFGGRVAGSVLLVDDRRASPMADSSAAAVAVSAVSAATVSHQLSSSSTSYKSYNSVATQSLVEVNRASVQRRRSRRDFAVPKQKLKAKFASLSRDLAQQRHTSVIANVEDHLVFSDYL